MTQEDIFYCIIPLHDFKYQCTEWAVKKNINKRYSMVTHSRSRAIEYGKQLAKKNNCDLYIYGFSLYEYEKELNKEKIEL